MSSGKSVRLSALSRNASAYSRSGSQLRRCGFFAGFARPLNPRRALCTVDSLGLGAAVGSMGRVSAYEQRNMLQLHIVLQRSTDVAIPRAGIGAVYQRMHADARDKHWCARCQLGAELHANEVRSGVQHRNMSPHSARSTQHQCIGATQIDALRVQERACACPRPCLCCHVPPVAVLLRGTNR